MKTCDWNAILDEVDVDYLQDFVDGYVTRHEFRTVHPEARRLVEERGVDNARTLARKALRRRLTRV